MTFFVSNSLKTACILIFMTPTLLWAAPKVIAHRGASAYLPEHTLAAKALAHGFNPDYIEQDVVLTKDGVPIVLHDIHLDTVTDVDYKFPHKKRKDGRYYAIDFTLLQIKQLNVHERIKLSDKTAVYPKRFPKQHALFNIPTLEEELILIQGLNKSRKKNVGIYVELKAPSFHKRAGKDIATPVIKLLGKYGYNGQADKAYIQCFDANYLKSIEPKTTLKLIQLIGENSWKESKSDYNFLRTDEGLKSIAQYAVGIGPWIPQLIADNSLVKRAQKNNLAVHPYTLRLDSLPENMTLQKVMKFLFSTLKVDGVFTDQPDAVKASLLKIKR